MTTTATDIASERRKLLARRIEILRERFEAPGSPPADPAPWPELRGVVAMLFTSRAGSSAISLHIAAEYDVGRVEESANFGKLTSVMKRSDQADLTEALKSYVGANSPGGWFAMKAGSQGLVSLELSGFADTYQHLGHYLMLMRRDVLAQAASLVIARKTGLFHSTQEKQRELQDDDYNLDEAMEQVHLIINGCAMLRKYILATGRPWRAVLYEDFAQGDTGGIDSALTQFGVPRRTRPPESRMAALTPVGGQARADWAARLRADLDDDGRAMVASYEEFVDKMMAEAG